MKPSPTNTSCGMRPLSPRANRPFCWSSAHHVVRLLYPIPGAPPLLPRFKQEFEKHKEFMLAPVIRRDDGKQYMEHSLGIVKNVILFRQLSEITSPDDTDAAALMLPPLITPAE